jgi:hypothetical protein
MKILLLPLNLILGIVSFIFKATGRLLGVILGLILMGAGIALTISVIGAIAGVPLTILGFLLTIRSLFK